jgi:O-antigen/teichoic acid export membrane protein
MKKSIFTTQTINGKVTSASSKVIPSSNGIDEEPTSLYSQKMVISFLSILNLRKWFYTLANQGVVSAMNFLTGVLIGRFCTKEEFGLYMLGFSIVLLVFDLQIALVSTPYMVFSPRLKDKSLYLYSGSSLIHQITLSTIVVFILVLCSVVLSFGIGPPGLYSVFLALVVTIEFIMFREFIRRICFAGLRMEMALFFDIGVATIQLIGLIILAKIGLLSTVRVYLLIGFACGFVDLIWFFLNRLRFKIQISHAISDLTYNWTFAKWVFASGILWTISMNLYPWLLTFFYGAASAGIWGACFGVIAIINVPLTGIQNFLGPKIANIYAEGGVRALRSFTFKISAILFVIMSILCCVLFKFSSYLLVLLYGEKYNGNGLVVVILALNIVATSVAFSFSRALFAIERADIDFKINFIPLLILFTVGIWTVRAFGPIGAAYGLLISNLIAAAIRIASFAKLTYSST